MAYSFFHLFKRIQKSILNFSSSFFQDEEELEVVARPVDSDEDDNATVAADEAVDDEDDEVIREFEPKEHCMLMKFVTSCSRAPLFGFKYLQPSFTIHKVACDIPFWTTFGGQDVDRLPSASTCYNTLKVPCCHCCNLFFFKVLNKTAHDRNQKYKEGKSVLERFKLSGPDGSNYWVSQEAQIGESQHDV